MKKLLSVLLVLVMILSFAACGKKEEAPAASAATPQTQEAPKDRLAKIKEAGVLQVCTEPYFAPNEFIDPNKSGQDQFVGFDMEIAKYIANEIGVKLEIVPLDFSAVLTGIADGKYDLAISALAYSPVRAEAMAMSKGYYFGGSGYGLVCRAEDAGKYETLDDLKNAIVVTQSGSVQESIYYQNNIKCKEFKLVSSMTDAYLSVMEGKADVCVCARSSAELYSEANGNKLYVPEFTFEVGEEMTGTRIAACLKDTDSLMEVVNKCIDDLRAKDQIEAWRTEAIEYAKKLGVE